MSAEEIATISWNPWDTDFDHEWADAKTEMLELREKLIEMELSLYPKGKSSKRKFKPEEVDFLRKALRRMYKVSQAANDISFKQACHSAYRFSNDGTILDVRSCWNLNCAVKSYSPEDVILKLVDHIDSTYRDVDHNETLLEFLKSCGIEFAQKHG